ncbi:hypothetical protein ACW180_00830 [Limosilactobacillus fermentum]
MHPQVEHYLAIDPADSELQELLRRTWTKTTNQITETRGSKQSRAQNHHLSWLCLYFQTLVTTCIFRNCSALSD